MKPNKRLAALAAVAIATTGIVALTQGAAQATSTSTPIFSGVKPSVSAATVSEGTKNIALTVTPATAPINTGIAVTVSSSDLAFNNGPIAPAVANGNELDALITLNGVNYNLRGPQNTTPVVANDGGSGPDFVTFNGGWVISSAPGGSSGTSITTNVPTTTGVGATIQGSEATPVTLTAPGTAGTYTIVLRSLVFNTLSGSSTIAVGEQFDAGYNKASANATGPADVTNGPWNGYKFDIPASYITQVNEPLVVTGPVAQIDKVTTQSNTYDVPGSSSAATALAGGLGSPAIRAGDFFTFSGNNSWPASAKVFATICTTNNCAAGTGAPPGAEAALWAGTAGGYSQGAGFSTLTSAGGVLQSTPVKFASFSTYSGTNYVAIYTSTAFRSGGPIFAGNGPTSAGTTASSIKAMYLLIAARTATTTTTAASVGGSVTVTGSNFYPGESVQIGTADSSNVLLGSPTTVTADANGSISGATTIGSIAAAKVYATGHGPTGSVTAFGGSFTVSGSSCTVISVSCDTTQNLFATVTAGTLSQAAALTNGCTGIITSAAPTLPTGPGFAPVNGCNTDASSIGFGAIQTSTAAGSLQGSLNTITVTDTRGGLTGWSLTGVIANTTNATFPTSLVNGSGATAGQIPRANVTIGAASCTPVSGSAPGVTAAAAAASFGTSVVLCQKDTQLNAGGSTSGQYIVASTLNLNVPAYQPTGLYQATMTITLA